MDFHIKRIYGTTSNCQLDVAVSTNYVAYVASGGVVVSKIDKEEGRLTSQRFFCATNFKSYGSSNSQNGSIAAEIDKDHFGIPRPSHTICINNSLSSQIKDLSLSSPPKLNSQQSQKIKTISCVSISPDERYLAVGESGSQPRILLFSLAGDSNNYPFLSINEHQFGVIALKFSQDSKFLLSIGDTHDGFIYLWKLSGIQPEIIGANKCTSQINGVHWIDDTIITFGIRHIKIWRFESFEKKSMIQGKNVILGDFINSNFIYCTQGVGDDDFLFLNSLGEIAGYNSASNLLKLKFRLEKEDNTGVILHDPINANLWVASDLIKSIPIEEILQSELESLQFDGNLDSPTKVKFIAKITYMELLNEKSLLYVTSSEEIKIFNIKTGESLDLIDSLSKSSSGLKSAANGEIINWTKNGIIKSIAKDTLDLRPLCKVEVPVISNKVIENHITSLDISPANDIIAGDAYGNLTISNPTTQEMKYSASVHEYSVNDVIYFKIDQVEFIVSIGRDRMIQVFARTDVVKFEEVAENWEIVQTLAEHKGNLLKVIYHKGTIYVSSADRSISSHKFIVNKDSFKIQKDKTVSLKSTPSAMTIHNNDFIVCTMDKQVIIYNLNTLETVRSLKLFGENNESLLVDNVVVNNENFLICSCTDKSVRVFDYHNGKQLSLHWGHSEPIKCLVPISSNEIITLSNSGCLFSWILKEDNQQAESTIGNFNNFNKLEQTPKVVRKIRRPSAISTSITPIKRSINVSPTNVRTPTTARLQSTNRLTPSKLSSTPKTNLSPSPTNSPLNTKTPRVSVFNRSSPSPKPSLKGSSSNTIINRGINNENRVSVGELISNLKSFKENVNSYTQEEIMMVKKEVNEMFEVEERLLQRYNAMIMNILNDK